MAINPNHLKGIVLIFPFFIFLHANAFAQLRKTSIIWEREKAIGVSFQIEKEEGESIQVCLKDRQTSILGKYKEDPDEIIFYPVVPFTYGLNYEIRIKEEVIQEFSVPFPPGIKRPSVLHIYPTSKTVPANLLKIHIQFTQSMQEGKSNQFISMLNEQGAIVPDVFLDLQPELWNEDRTSLTIWLDPGRIKRDLQPNLKMGPPLEAGRNYTVFISKKWKDVHGLELDDDFKIEYHVISDDREKPSVDQWKISSPIVNTKNDLIINFGEPIDFELAQNTIFVLKDGQMIEGFILLKEQELLWVFKPAVDWSVGKYEIAVETRLEDLAGNNLHRLFDNKIEKDDPKRNEDKFRKISFTVGEGSMQ